MDHACGTYGDESAPFPKKNLETKCLSGVAPFPPAGWFAGRKGNVLHKSVRSRGI